MIFDSSGKHLEYINNKAKQEFFPNEKIDNNDLSNETSLKIDHLG
jgi:hypothetical protein